MINYSFHGFTAILLQICLKFSIIVDNLAILCELFQDSNGYFVLLLYLCDIEYRIENTNNKMNKITMLGTGNATVTQIYNTCFVLETDTTKLLVDAGGGNGVLGILKKVNIPISDFHYLLRNPFSHGPHPRRDMGD